MIPPKLMTAVTAMRTAKEIQYRTEFVSMTVPVNTPAIAPTAEIVLKPWAGKQRNA